jgi:hypothetical protein
MARDDQRHILSAQLVSLLTCQAHRTYINCSWPVSGRSDSPAHGLGISINADEADLQSPTKGYGLHGVARAHSSKAMEHSCEQGPLLI